MSVVFSRASGVSCVSRCSAPACWGGWRVAGGSGVRGLARPGVLLPSCWGAGLGCVCARPVPELSGSGCGRGRWPGSGCACCPVPVVGVGLCPVSCSCSRCSCSCSRGVFGCCFFRPVLLVSSGSAVLGPLLGCGFRGVGGLWGVSGWVRGCFFSGFCCTGPGLFPVSFVGAGLGLGWVLFGEFDPGSGRTLAACLTHASRTGPPSFLGVG